MTEKKEGRIKKRRTDKGPKFRELTKTEAEEEDIYKRQLIGKWGYEEGETPYDQRRKREAAEGT